jgi:hypothetical protein
LGLGLGLELGLVRDPKGTSHQVVQPAALGSERCHLQHVVRACCGLGLGLGSGIGLELGLGSGVGVGGWGWGWG